MTSAVTTNSIRRGSENILLDSAISKLAKDKRVLGVDNEKKKSQSIQFDQFERLRSN